MNKRTQRDFSKKEQKERKKCKNDSMHRKKERKKSKTKNHFADHFFHRDMEDKIIIQQAPLNVITLGQTKSDNINRVIT